MVDIEKIHALESAKMETEAHNLRLAHCIRLDQGDLCTAGPVQEVFKRYPVLTQIKDMGMPTIAGLLAYDELFELDASDLAELDTKTMLVMLQYELLRLKKKLRQEMARI